MRDGGNSFGGELQQRLEPLYVLLQPSQILRINRFVKNPRGVHGDTERLRFFIDRAVARNAVHDQLKGFGELDQFLF
jgi:hypothetical protein